MLSSTDAAFRAVKRTDFVPYQLKSHAQLDVALPIGFGQTISQPFTVRLMLEWLDAQPVDTVLDIGSGSGWTTALLSKIVGPNGKVYAVEKIPELLEFGRENCRRAKCTNVKFFEAGDSLGLPKHAPFNRILISASADEFPEELIDQLKAGGKLVIPVREDILEITKTSEKDYETLSHPGFIFVPLVN